MSTPEQIADGLRAAADTLRREPMHRAVLLAERAIKHETPVKRGTLRRSITSRVDSPTRGVVGTNLRYAVYVHEGTRPHVITPVTKRALFWTGAAHPVKRVQHPGTRANPFLVRGVERARHDIERALADLGDAALGQVG